MKSSSFAHELGDVVELEVQRLSYPHGHGVARLDGFVVFVEGSAPCERVRAKIIEIHARHAVARISEIVQPSSDRRSEPCVYARTCGGCTWQHITEDTQLREKQSFLSRIIHNLGDLASQVSLGEFVASPQTLRYRNRIQVHVVDGNVSYFARGSNRLIAIEDCLLAEPELVDELKELRLQAQTDVGSSKRRFELVKYVSGQTDRRSTTDDPQAAYFAQVNRFTNELLLNYVAEVIRAHSPANIFDLYAGQGNFGLHLSEKLAPEAAITMVELSEVNCHLCREAIAYRHLSNIRAVQSEVFQFLSGLNSVPPSSVVILDPPRPGCASSVLSELLRLKPSAIIYVSCNPSTLERDLKKLLAGGHYALRSLQGFDMFPQTPHLEAVAVLHNIALRHRP